MGEVFGRYTVISAVSSTKYVKYLCRCICGAEKVVAGSDLRRGHSKSCGCLRNELNRTRHITHGKQKTPAYRSWAGMKQRTTNSNNPDWNYYGGRGIRLCDRWLSFENFLEDMGEPALGLTIDRIDPNGDYEPENCRWATRKQQRLNQRQNSVTTDIVQPR